MTKPVLRFPANLVTGDRESSDRQLLERFVNGADGDAFQALVRRYGPLVLGVCARVLGSEHSVEDAYQATFLVFVRKAGSLRAPESLGPWLYGVAYRTALKARAERAQRRRRERPLVEAASPSNPDDLIWHDLRSVLDEEVNRLPRKHRAAVVLCYFGGKTNEQAARLLGCPPGTIFSRLAWARDRLRRQLVRRGLTLSAPALAGFLAGNATAASAVGVPSQAAFAFATGQTVGAGTVPAPAVALAKGVLKAMFVTKLKIAAAVLLAVGTVGTGVGALAYSALAGEPPVQTVRAERDEKPKSDKDALQGTWVAVAAEEGGKKVTEDEVKDKNLEIVFSGDKVTLPIKGEAKEMTFKLDPTKKPKQIDFVFSKTETAEGIYELDGDKLTLCVTKPDHGDRPTKFDSADDTGGRERALIVLKRKK
jgi:RNA polymerase sigma factor (sigma-70 family)